MRRLIAGGWLAAVCAGAPSASAQERPWALEFELGATAGSDPVGGTATPLPPGVTFVIPGSLPGAEQRSRQVPSWFFGDGVQLFREATRQTLSGIDDAITRNPVRSDGGATVGLRFTRRVLSRVSVGGSLGYGPGTSLEPAAVAALENAAASFQTSFRALPARTRDVSAVATVSSSSTNELAATAIVSYDFRDAGTVVPFVVGGIGVVSRIGDASSAHVEGAYVVESPGVVNGVPIAVSEHDVVDVGYDLNDHGLLSTIGGGLRIALTPRWLLRVETRASFVRQHVDVLVSASPTTDPPPPNVAAAIFVGSPTSLSFSNFAVATRPPPTIIPSSLSGPALDDFVSFSGSGTATRFSVSAAIGVRF
jgi:hypothetical protein